MTDGSRTAAGAEDARSSSDDASDRCARCGEAFDRRDWHYPGVARDDGELQVLLFCSEHCRARWEFRTRTTTDATDA
jgi:hypothetical protein